MSPNIRGSGVVGCRSGRIGLGFRGIVTRDWDQGTGGSGEFRADSDWIRFESALSGELGANSGAEVAGLRDPCSIVVGSEDSGDVVVRFCNLGEFMAGLEISGEFMARPGTAGEFLAGSEISGGFRVGSHYSGTGRFNSSMAVGGP
ncbi:hypothetical protein TIFTF001_037977 [Ficus carica]|uniref:Uncharacterized protein n=1 Tax=Ficus carica TaxID=3494 RepID=A0AA88J9I2_FICCA|nr:hypothetical protein TIFTF001_037977 [Ficus carica]